MPDESQDLWTRILDFLLQLVAPVWNELIQYLPVLLLGAVILLAAETLRQWRRAGELNRSRVPRRLRTPPAPAGIHLPGPSRWPFVVPIGAMLLLFGLALPPRGADGELLAPVNLPLVGVGLLVLAVAVGGWLRDAMREWRGTAAADAATGGATAVTALSHGAGGRAAAIDALAPGPRPDLAELPPGIHLPPPSPWPLFAPIGATVIFFGFVLSPVLIIGGIVMTVIAIIGWYRDAGTEYRQTEAGQPPQPRPMDPEQAFPKRLVPVYLGIAAVTFAIAALPLFFSILPQPGGAPGGSPGASVGPPPDQPQIAASAVTEFETDELVVPAERPFPLLFNNKQAGVPHNLAIYDTPDRGTEHFVGELVTGPMEVTYEVPALAAGEYFFVCTVHPPMTGTLIAR